MSDDAQFRVGITARDQTAAGVKASEKRIGEMTKRVGINSNKSAKDQEKAIGRIGSSFQRTFGQVEKASGRLFGRSGLLGGNLTSRLGMASEAASTLGGGFEAAAGGATLLRTASAAVAGTVGAAVAVLGAAAYAAYKLGSGWAESAAKMGRVAEIIGISTKALTEFNAAAERSGVDKGTATGAIGGLSQTLNDARYGRNTQALEAMRRLGIRMQLNQDGTVDTAAMLPAIADAIRGQNSSGRRTVARALGIPEAALPAFSQGGKSLSAEMSDAGKHGVAYSDPDVRLAEKMYRDDVRASQGAARVGNTITGGIAGYTAGAHETVADVVDTFNEAVSGDFKPAAKEIGRAADTMDRASRRASGFVSPLTGARRAAPSGLKNGTLHLSQQDVIDLKKTVQTEWGKKDVLQLQGVVDTILNRQATGHWGKSIASVVNSRTQFTDVNGPVAWKQGRHSVSQIPMSQVSGRVSALVDEHLRARMAGSPSVVGDSLNYANPYYSDKKHRPWINKLDTAVYGDGRNIHRYGTTPELQKYSPGPFKIKVDVELKGAPKGTRATVTTQDGGISRAFQND